MTNKNEKTRWYSWRAFRPPIWDAKFVLRWDNGIQLILRTSIVSIIIAPPPPKENV